MSTTMPEAAKKVWRDGIAPLLTTPVLQSLRRALANDDPTLIQGATTDPDPLMCCARDTALGACLLAWTGYEDGLTTVEELEEHFGRLCFECDQRIGGPGECRWLLNFWDEYAREDARRLLLAEIDLALSQRDGTLDVGRAG